MGSGGLEIGRTHLQKVVLNVAIESATQADRVLLPQLVHLQVEAELAPAVLKSQPGGRSHLQEHGGQLLDVEHVWGRRGAWKGWKEC